ncbi:MAG: DUF4291 domain-containing protein [Cytophagales bacterium]|nr:MAG: DUF4291 domain-containing protein [Cytophagales bacterium]
MKLKTIPYEHYETNLPKSGQHIVGQIRDENIIVYQAFNKQIANFAVGNQAFGGSAYSFNRMSWIKPNFLWMMYRAGWAKKDNQERILAIEFSLKNFQALLKQAVHSSFTAEIYGTEQNWKQALGASEVRLQWDPDHDPYGNKLTRRAMQLGLRGETLKCFATDWIISIEDITDFVLEQGDLLKSGRLRELQVAEEQVVEFSKQ